LTKLSTGNFFEKQCSTSLQAFSEITKHKILKQCSRKFVTKALITNIIINKAAAVMEDRCNMENNNMLSLQEFWILRTGTQHDKMLSTLVGKEGSQRKCNGSCHTEQQLFYGHYTVQINLC